tara:strand:- start:99 stop:398 length:300 start_codon:yes stop_codon:yes gene_type:complete
MHIKETTNIAIKFKLTPALTITLMSIFPLPKITALGGVAIGSIKAQLAAIVVGITKYNGLTFNPVAKTIKIGVNVATVAVFEFNSVKNIITNTETNIKR